MSGRSSPVWQASAWLPAHSSAAATGRAGYAPAALGCRRTSQRAEHRPAYRTPARSCCVLVSAAPSMSRLRSQVSWSASIPFTSAGSRVSAPCSSDRLRCRRLRSSLCTQHSPHPRQATSLLYQRLRGARAEYQPARATGASHFGVGTSHRDASSKDPSMPSSASVTIAGHIADTETRVPSRSLLLPSNTDGRISEQIVSAPFRD